jgi:hypothetical protein
MRATAFIDEVMDNDCVLVLSDEIMDLIRM